MQYFGGNMDTVAQRLQGGFGSRYWQEFFGNSAYFPLASIFLELLLHDATAYLSGPDPYLLLGAALGQSGLLVR
ncbi:MAG: hypothetical protein C3L25_09175 [Candidatus Sedimenticola endophacoides]|nr:MAG: hypothetical protein C3L26_09265 [Candidatus Sedimenticola endophacoides]PUE02938.1 MAG: hypothetical protein C3L25_09175 [Candidatus Sedimenticola endophacoides]